MATDLIGRAREAVGEFFILEDLYVDTWVLVAKAQRGSGYYSIPLSASTNMTFLFNLLDTIFLFLLTQPSSKITR